MSHELPGLAFAYKGNTTSYETTDFFGHSVSIIDGDIIREFIKAENMKTTIIYHDMDSLSTAVANLSAILDKDDLIIRTGGNTRTLEFISQKELDPASVSLA